MYSQESLFHLRFCLLYFCFFLNLTQSMNRNECLCRNCFHWELWVSFVSSSVLYLLSGFVCVVQSFKSICLFLFVFHFRQFFVCFGSFFCIIFRSCDCCCSCFLTLDVPLVGLITIIPHFLFNCFTLHGMIFKIYVRHASPEAKRIRSFRSVSRTIRVVLSFSVQMVKPKFVGSFV